MGFSCRFIVVVSCICLQISEGNISDKRLCGDPNCSDPVSVAKTLTRYFSDDARILSFAKNVDCLIYSKSAGSRPDLWGAEINGKRGYVPKGFVREYKILKSSLKFTVNTEAAENIRNSTVKNVTDEFLMNASSSEVNRHETSKLEAELNDVEHSGLEPDSGSGILKETPLLDDFSLSNLLYAHIGLPSFSGSGVSAEPVESETSPNHEVITQPFEVVDGTVLYYDTDGEQTESKLSVSDIQPTFTTLRSLQSVVPEQKSKLGNEPVSVPATVVGEPSTSTVFGSIEEDVKETQPDKVKKTGAVEKKVDESVETQPVKMEETETVEKKTELGSVADKLETDYVVDKEVESIVEHKQEVENIGEKHVDAVDESNKELDSVEDKEEDSFEEPVKEVINEIEESVEDDEEEYDENEDEEDDYHEDDDDDDEEEVNEEVTEKNNMDTDDQKHVEEVKSVNSDDSALLAGGETLKLGNQDAAHLTLETDVNASSISVNNNSEADSPNLQEDIKDLSLDMAEKLADVYETSREIITDEPSTLEHTEPISDSDNQNVLVNANETDDSFGNAEESEVKVMHDNVTEAEGSDVSEHVDAHQVSGDRDDPLDSVSGGDTSVEGGEVTDFSGEIIGSVYGTGYPGDFSENLEARNVNVHPEPVSGEITDYNTEMLSEIEDGIKSTLSEEPDLDSVHEKIETATSSAEEYYEVPQNETSTEESIMVIPTLPSEKEGSELASEQEEIVESSGSLFSGVTDSLSAGIAVLESMFGGLSSDSLSPEAPEEANEGNLQVTSENIPPTAETEGINRKKDVRDAASSLWEIPNRENSVIGSGGNHYLSEDTGRTPSACKVNYDPSAGIDSDCSEVSGDVPSIQQQPESVPSIPEDSVIIKFPEDGIFTMDLQRSSYETLLYLIVTAATVLLFSLGHYYIEKRRRDGSLVAKINCLEKELLVSSKECLILKDNLQATKEKLISVENTSADNSEVVVVLKAELEGSKVAKAELEEQVTSLEKELEAATEAGLELNRMLSEFLSAQHGSDTVMKSVEQVQKQLDSQQSTIATMTASLNAKNTENEALQADLTAAKDKIISLEEDMQKVNENLNDVLSAKLTMEEELLEKNKSLQTQLHEVEDGLSRETNKLQNENSKLQDTINKLKDKLVTKESEITVLQESLKHLKNSSGEEGDDKFEALLDVGHIKVELKLMTIERDALVEKLQGEEDARKLLEDHVKVISEEVTRLRGSYDEAEKEKIEAQTRLEVLSNYFKQKETQLQKELGLQEAMYLQKEGDATSTYERIKSLKEEIENYKSQNESLKKEILDQERGLKCQIAALEKKAHENWVAARQAERKLEESRQEGSQLRNRLIVVEKNVINTSKTGETSKTVDRMPGDSNGELPTSPVHVGISAFQDSPSSPLHYQHHDGLPASPPVPALIPGQPLPPSPFMGMPPLGVFIPPPPPGTPFMPPPPPLFPGDRRPPPLGRMSSPPPHRYTPPPPDPRGSFSPYDHSPPPSPPPGRPYRSPPPRGGDSPDRFRQHRSPPPPPPPHYSPYSSTSSRPPLHREDSHRFRPLPPPTHRDSPREPKGPTLSSGHSSESLDNSSRQNSRV